MPCLPCGPCGLSENANPCHKASKRVVAMVAKLVLWSDAGGPSGRRSHHLLTMQKLGCKHEPAAPQCAARAA